jgi:hypothetical protein
VLPILYYTPETSAGFGIGTLLQFDLPGAREARRPSSLALGAVYTLRHQLIGEFMPELRFKNDMYVLRLEAVGARFPNRFYGIGNEPRSNVYDTYTDRYLRTELDLRMRPWEEGKLRPFFLGINHAGGWSTIRDERPSRAGRDLFASIQDRGEREVWASGFGPSVAWDSRDSINWPRRGQLLDVRGTAFAPGLGGNVRYQRLMVDLRNYRSVWRDHVLAMRFAAQAVWGQVPFQRLPQLGGAMLFRGWYAGALRQSLLMALEMEYRVPISTRWAAVAFGSMGRVARDIRHFDLAGLHFAGGAGVRFSLDKRDRVNVRLDLAYGNALYPYLQFREAF